MREQAALNAFQVALRMPAQSSSACSKRKSLLAVSAITTSVVIVEVVVWQQRHRAANVDANTYQFDGRHRHSET
jgi:hypothetical protein